MRRVVAEAQQRGCQPHDLEVTSFKGEHLPHLDLKLIAMHLMDTFCLVSEKYIMKKPFRRKEY